MIVLVTGANGMFATNIIEVCLSKGWQVRGLLRCKESYKSTTHPNLELIEGDFTNYDSAQKAVNGCDSIIHSAAITSQNLLNYESYRRVNVVEAAKACIVALKWGDNGEKYLICGENLSYR